MVFGNVGNDVVIIVGMGSVSVGFLPLPKVKRYARITSVKKSVFIYTGQPYQLHTLFSPEVQ